MSLVPHAFIIHVSDLHTGACVHVWVWRSICIRLIAEYLNCVRVHMCECMHEYVSHAPLSSPVGFKFWCPSFSSSTSQWTQWTLCCLHSPPPPAHSVSIYHLAHSHAHLFSHRLCRVLPPSPYSISFILTHSCSLVFSVFSLVTSPPSLFITVRLRPSPFHNGSDRHSGPLLYTVYYGYLFQCVDAGGEKETNWINSFSNI